MYLSIAVKAHYKLFMSLFDVVPKVCGFILILAITQTS